MILQQARLKLYYAGGTTGPQAENIVKLKTAGGVEGADPNVLPVSEETARLQVRNGRVVPEYTTDLSVADRFSREHYLIIVKVKAKYITRGSVSESGWVYAIYCTSGTCWHN
ncbi:secretion protein EspN [Salmonella enterica subsp. arizonae]|uniref:Secretion protein EspN n=1 Tax=Salmonella enterica subsp. arizonae TaxID=59203 RepID=A0A379TAY0_SALER|nr:secretion protein EspN [Salmonella enterica subsp. arizonae]